MQLLLTSDANEFVNAESRSCVQERNLCLKASAKIKRFRKIRENDCYWLLNDFEQTNYFNETDNKFNRNILKLNSLSHKLLNIHIFPPQNVNSTNSNILSGTFNRKPCKRALWRELRTWGISLRIYSAVLHRSHAAHFPLKHPYFFWPKPVLLQLAIEVK